MNSNHTAEGEVEIFPVFTSSANRNQDKGPGRAVHLGTPGQRTLCGTHKTHPHLLFDSGFPIGNLRQFLSADADGALCKRCGSIGRKLVQS